MIDGNDYVLLRGHEGLLLVVGAGCARQFLNKRHCHVNIVYRFKIHSALFK